MEITDCDLVYMVNDDVFIEQLKKMTRLRTDVFADQLGYDTQAVKQLVKPLGINSTNKPQLL